MTDYSSMTKPCVCGGKMRWKGIIGQTRKIVHYAYICDVCGKRKIPNEKETAEIDQYLKDEK